VAMLVLTAVNAWGVVLFSRCNALLTWLKVAVPVVVAVLFIADRFTLSNFTAAGGFAPMGVQGILAAVSTGGVLFAFFGFRNAIELAGEVRDPQVTMPLALGLAVAICAGVYILVQIAFLGALSESELSRGWAHIESDHQLGPLAAIAIGLGMLWLSGIILAGAVLAPFGAALVTTASTSRLALAMARNRFFPRFLSRLSARQVPLNGLLFNLGLGVVLMILVPFDDLVALVSAALILSLGIGPVVLMSLRRQLADAPRAFRLPFAAPLCALAFVVAALAIHWAGWETTRLLLIVLAAGGVLFAVNRFRRAGTPLDVRPALWLVPYLAGLALVSWLGGFGGGLGILPFGWSTLLCAGLGLAAFAVAVRSRLEPDVFDSRLADLIASGSEGAELGTLVGRR
ncbi:MAG: amino acid permease, partial [bacterium]|nr:amino acid permease [bacterium]